MSTSPAEHPVPGVVTFTARGDAALDQLAASLAAQCDGSPASIAYVLGQVLDADIEQLTEALTEAADHARPPQTPASDESTDFPATTESTDEAARRRLGARPEHSTAPTLDQRPTIGW
jgi:hypothetical protein